jgi:hypothetical protein
MTRSAPTVMYSFCALAVLAASESSTDLRRWVSLGNLVCRASDAGGSSSPGHSTVDVPVGLLWSPYSQCGTLLCVECLIGKQKKPILFKVTEPSSIPYRTPPACAKMAAYSDPPPVIPVPESGVAQAAYAETLLPGSAPARNVSRYWGSPRACYRIPCCE